MTHFSCRDTSECGHKMERINAFSNDSHFEPEADNAADLTWN